MDTVECHSDTEYAEHPRAVHWQGQRLEVTEVLSRWHQPYAKGFRIRTTGGGLFEVIYREIPDTWEIQPL